MVVIAESFGILSKTYGDYIIFAGIAIQIILLIAFVILSLTSKGRLKRGVKIIRHKIEDKYIKGNIDILPTFISPTNPRKATIFQIYIEAKDVKEDPRFNMCKIIGGGPEKMIDIKKHVLHVNTGIVGDLFIFVADLIVRPDEKINFKFENDINIKTLFIGELYMP